MIRVIFAFLLSPLIYLLVYTLAVMLFAAFVEESYSVSVSPFAYFSYLLGSVPVFLLVHRLYGWTFLSCLGSALLVVIALEVVGMASTLWLASAVAAFVYGGVFWLLVSPDFRGRVVT